METTEYTQTFYKPQVVIDIETMPNMDVIDLLPEPSIDSRLKDPVKIEEAKKNGRESQIEKMALSPLTGKVACIGFYGAVHEVRIDDEKAMLDYAHSIILSHQIITYNGKSFDIPFIFKRGIILGCEWATIPNMKKYTDKYKSGDRHIDLMTEFCDYGQWEKLDNLARFLLGSKKVDFDFREIPELLKSDEGKAKLTEYCYQDCKLTWELAQKMGFEAKALKERDDAN